MTVDLATLLKTALPTITILIPIVMALVRYWGKLGLTGTWQLVSSMLTGLVLGGAVMYVEITPTTPADYLIVILTGLITGLVASGVYDVGKDIMSKS